MELQAFGNSRKSKLNDTGDLFRFFAMVRNLMLWMDDLMRQVSIYNCIHPSIYLSTFYLSVYLFLSIYLSI